MASNKRTIIIYIHPKHGGPVTPMELDVSAIEVAVLKAPDGSSSDEVGAREIARQIRAKFSAIKPENYGRVLSMFMRRMSNFEIFNGVVLSLDGTIETTPSPVEKELLDTTQKLAKQVKDLNNEKRTWEKNLQVQMQGLQSKNDRLKAAHEDDLKAQTRRLQQAEDEAQQLRRAVLQAHDEIIRAQEEVYKAHQQVSNMETRLLQLQQELQERPKGVGNEKELAELRYKEKKAREAELQIRETVSALQQENEALRKELQRLAEGPASTPEPLNDEIDLYVL